MPKKEATEYLVYSPLNFKPRPHIQKYQPSIVVPDKTLSLTTILGKYAGGQYHGREPIFTDPEFMDIKQGIDARKLCISELQNLQKENQYKIQSIQKEIELQNFKKQAAASAAQKERDKQQWLKELQAEKDGKSTNTP